VPISTIPHTISNHQNVCEVIHIVNAGFAAQSAGYIFSSLAQHVKSVDSKTRDFARDGKGSEALFASWPRAGIQKLWFTTDSSIPEYLTV